MNTLTLALWLLNVTVDCGGQLAFKAAAQTGSEHTGWQYWRQLPSRGWLWLGIACYLLEFVLWLAFLTRVPLAKGVMLGSLSIVLIMLAGRLLFHERLTGWRLAGMLLISLGVALVGVQG
ncbi:MULTISPECIES: EamA family transporter [unclassified Erwinia]|uniref:EamA family transporter n=1 Tax=unclassified Erwinia TaxID=2622719 RepID=UPI0006F56ADF|nr:MULTISPECIES: EamA family transporter [unclassified Erwinia]KQN54293.1 hypothetical protein ASF13_12720 [Erwinia sp. Leaf53]PLV51737.1 membrane protein [Erwinia sp. B116]